MLSDDMLQYMPKVQANFFIGSVPADQDATVIGGCIAFDLSDVMGIPSSTPLFLLSKESIDILLAELTALKAIVTYSAPMSSGHHDTGTLQ